MPTGSCLCGKLRYEYTGEPAGKKISGSAFSVNALIPEDTFKVTSGKPSEYTKTADSGEQITSFFCAECGSTPWRETKTFEGNKILKAGTLDNKTDLDTLKPAAELYNGNRSSWIPEFPGTEHHKAMPS
ncbi:hypothetical protein MMC10_001190 [Thelotrema lepadinum]|nr:hypothetical protein [Thelotrema lepadinum]